MKILYHHRTLSEDGQAVHIRALQRAFREEGHDVLEVSLVRQGSEGKDDKGASANAGRSRWSWVGRLPRFAHELMEYGYTGVARPRIVRAAASFDPDFIYERYAFGNAAGVLAARRVHRPVVLEVNSPMVLELTRTRGLSFPRLADKLERFVFGRADLVCVVTSVLGDMLAEAGVPRERLLVTPNGVHPDAYPDAGSSSSRERARRDLGVPDTEGAVLGFVGYARDWHRLDLVVDCLAEPGLEDARLVLVGAGPADAGLRELAAARGVADRVHFAGRREHGAIPALLAAFDVALVPAINAYASPLKLHEYMAASLAVIAPDQPNLREVVQDGDNALLVPPGDREALLAALLLLVGDADLRARLGASARETIVERDLTWRGNARRVVEAVRDL